MNPTGNADTSWLCNVLQPRRNVYAVPVDVVLFNNHVALVDAHSEFNTLVLGNMGVSLSHGALDIDGTLNGIEDRGELDKESIAGRFDNTPGVLGDLGIDHLFAMGLELSQGSGLISPHQPAVTNDVGCEDCCKSAFVASALHDQPPINPEHTGLTFS